MLSKAKTSLIRSLEQKKFRKEHNLFVVEGEKMLLELANSSFKVSEVFVTGQFDDKHLNLFPNSEVVSETELSKISFLKTVSAGLALVEIPKAETNFIPKKDNFYLALDGIRDPGNLGTIIRTADWFGLSDLICSSDSVDCFNPKTIQASMGAIFRVKVHYVNLPETLKAINKDIPVYGADMKGDSLFKAELKNGIVVVGNEADGLRTETREQIANYVAIPKTNSQAESLNAAVSAAIICAEFARNA